MKRSQFKGKFKPKNTSKYKGNIKQIIYRSSWERLFMTYCDRHPHILEWSSEEVKIPYFFEGKNRTYYPDFWIKMIDSAGHIVEHLVEIKPHYQKRWGINKMKWEYARALKGLGFIVLTEKELF